MTVDVVGTDVGVDCDVRAARDGRQLQLRQLEHRPAVRGQLIGTLDERGADVAAQHGGDAIAFQDRTEQGGGRGLALGASDAGDMGAGDAAGIADLEDARLERRHNLQRRAILGESRAIKRDAWTDQIEVEVASEVDSGGIGQGGRQTREFASHLAEERELRLVQRMAGIVGAGEMAHQHFGGRGGQELGPARQADSLVQREAQAVHAGVDVDDRRRSRAMPGPRLDAFQAVKDRAQTESTKVSRPFGEEAVQHIDCRIGRGGAHTLSLLRHGHEKCPAAGFGQRRNRALDAYAVSIGLDDGGAFGR